MILDTRNIYVQQLRTCKERNYSYNKLEIGYVRKNIVGVHSIGTEPNRLTTRMGKKREYI